MIQLSDLIARHAQAGAIEAIWLRPARHAPPEAVATAELHETGLLGDHARPGKRALTLIQAEHLPVIAQLAGREAVDPALLRRNLVVSRLNLSTLRGACLKIGETARVKIIGPCAPCSRMEAALGYGGYNAMRGHGGWCAQVLTPGPIRVGDALQPEDREG